MKKLFILFFILITSNIHAFDSFTVSDIRIVGLQRVSTGSIFNVIPISVGDEINQRKSSDIVKSLFLTEQFDDIEIGRDKTTLIISVKERPSISSIEITGNKALKTEQLLESLDGVGIREGEVYKRSTLEKVRSELVRSYASNGKYGASVEILELNRPRNTIEISVEIDEGDNARIEKIRILGNEIFTDEELLDTFELKEGSFFSFLSNNNQYSREKLTGDIESLEAFYFNRGYLKFSIESSQVSLSRDKKSIYITFNINEGNQYTIDDVNVVGDVPIDENIYLPLLESQKGLIYSQAQITQLEEFFTTILGNQGYAFAEVAGRPDMSFSDQKVNLTFVIDSGKRTYTRKILFTGNDITQDHVLRREMRQFEGAWTSDDRIEAGKIRLERLGYFKEVKVETVPVSGTDDQIDIIYSVEEESTGSIGGNIGYSDFGLQLGFNLSQQNFLGSGNTVAAGINKSIYSESYNFSYINPYQTIDGVSLGANLYFRETDYGEYQVANYLANSYGLGFQFGYPISDTQRIGFNFTFDKTDIDVGTLPAREIWDFTSKEGTTFNTLSSSLTWSRVTLNRGMFPTDGSSTSLSLLATMPGSDINYYKLSLQQRYYQPLKFANLVFGFQGQLGYLAPYGDTQEPPFFQNFYAGGPRSLRGFESNTLGPRTTQAPCYEFNYAEETCPNLIDTDGDGEADEPYLNPYANTYSRYGNAPIGGNIKLEGSTQLIFRLPFIEDQRSMRSAFFFDFGNVFSDNCKSYQFNCYEFDIGELRYSYGVGVTWITGFGPMSLAIAKPTNAGQFERTEEFQFTVGNVF
jgi:outer membrane protein insertion porin family